MRSIDIESLESLPGRLIKEGDAFSFQCHPGVSCFNLCCRNLNLFLHPYDVVRLKHNLAISSDRFLEEYVDVVLRDGNYFPDVLLRMSETDEKTCPFLTEAGCAVYPDRPDTCRTFPIEQGIHYNADGRLEQVNFFRPPEFCMGRHENKEWTIQTWSEDQEAVTYHRMTIAWSELKQLFQNNPWGREGPRGAKGKMAFMATYNIDRFRDFLFESSFIKRYKVKTDLLKKIKSDDTALMKFGFEWVKLFVWGVQTKQIRLR